MSMIYVSVSVSNDCVHLSTAADHGYDSFAEMARIIHCLLQKMKMASSLPLVEQWEEFVTRNHLRFPAIDEKDFLSGTSVMVAVDKVENEYLRAEFHCDTPGFFEEFLICLFSTVVSISLIGRDMSCFCPANVLGEDDVASSQLFNKLLDGLLEKGWTRGSEVEMCKAEYQFFVREQRQPQGSSTRNHPDVGSLLSFCSAQAGFHARQHLYKVCIVSNHACCFELSCVVFYGS